MQLGGPLRLRDVGHLEAHISDIPAAGLARGLIGERGLAVAHAVGLIGRGHDGQIAQLVADAGVAGPHLAEHFGARPGAEQHDRIEGQRLGARGAQTIRKPAAEEVGGNGPIPIDGELIVVFTERRMRIGPCTQHRAIENLAGIIRRHGIERGLARGDDALRQRIVRAVPE